MRSWPGKASALYVLALVFIGCGASSGVQRFTTACVAKTNLSEEICECAGKKAAEEFSAPAFDFLVATLDEDMDAMLHLRGQLPLPEIVATGMFMASAPARCAEELAESR